MEWCRCRGSKYFWIILLKLRVYYSVGRKLSVMKRRFTDGEVIRGTRIKYYDISYAITTNLLGDGDRENSSQRQKRRFDDMNIGAVATKLWSAILKLSLNSQTTSWFYSCGGAIYFSRFLYTLRLRCLYCFFNMVCILLSKPYLIRTRERFQPKVRARKAGPTKWKSRLWSWALTNTGWFKFRLLSSGNHLRIRCKSDQWLIKRAKQKRTKGSWGRMMVNAFSKKSKFQILISNLQSKAYHSKSWPTKHNKTPTQESRHNPDPGC